MNIIITGASQGIGYEIAMSFAKVQGTRLGIIARNRDKLEALSEHAASKDNRIIPYVYDLADLSERPDELTERI